ncbi:MAG: hypothetical protein ACYCW6_01945 [Candidatus Xenobia bacterium]
MSRHWLPIVLTILGIMVVAAAVLKVPLPAVVTKWLNQASQRFS